MTAPTSGFIDGAEHVLPVRIYYEDTDFTGVVYHANYLRYFERGRTECLRALGVSHSELAQRADPCAFVVTRIEVDFQRAARVDDVLMVRTVYGALRGARMDIRQRITRGDEAIAQAHVQLAFITPGGRARRPPGEIVERLRPHLAAPAAP